MIPIATVAPRKADGTVQFIEGGRKLGDPAPVVGGSAVGPLVSLRAGQHSITAVFTPAPGSVFERSTSNTVTFTF